MGIMKDYKPYLVSWNLTKRCNLACPHCYIDSNSRLRNLRSELSGDEARLVIDELSYLNSPLMLILSGGEPMLRDDIFEIVEYASEARFITVMGSNGILLTKENLKLLKKAGLKGVGVSIDSVDSRCHDSFRGLSGAWEMSVDSIRSAKEAGIEAQMDVSLTDKNVDHIAGFIELGASLSVKAVNFFFLVCTGRAMKTDIASYHYETALKKITEISKTEKRLMIRARCAPHIYRLLHESGTDIPEGTRGCLAGRHYMRIDPEGNITPCPYMPLAIGNIKKKSLTEIWEESPDLKKMREGAYKHKCGICKYAVICGGCRARALAESGDFMEEDSLCTYTPSGDEEIRLDAGCVTELSWDDAAKDRIRKVPVFMQGMIIKMIETKAKERGIEVITGELIGELKESLGVHANKRRS
ncbi:MAG: radical SAM protein [Nitrospiraceae bacterium]|nr:MAG: radical SAM protein [Nitrospiraceae bacterium]